MSENTTNTVRPTKKQRDLLTYIEQFIGEHGYSPSYREIMNGLSYTSVATVALHVNSLITRGHLRKRDRSARSLEVVNPSGVDISTKSGDQSDDSIKPADEKWLIDKIEQIFADYEQIVPIPAAGILDLTVLISALHLLGLADPAHGFTARLTKLKNKTDSKEKVV